MLNPILPIYAKTLGAPYWLVGMSVSSFFVTRAICEIPAGMFYNRLGWRIPILLSMIIQATAAALVYSTSDIGTLILARAIQGVGSTLFFLTAISFVASSAPKGAHGRFVGTFQGVEWIGSISGGVVGGTIAEGFGPKTVFLIVSLVLAAGAIFAMLLRYAHEDRPRTDFNGIQAVPWRALAGMPPFYVASAAIFFFMFSYQGIVNTVLPIYVNSELGFSLVFLGLLAMCVSVGQTVAMFAGGSLADRVGYKKSLAVVLTLSMTSIPLLSQVRVMEQLAVLSTIFGITVGIGLTIPVALISTEIESKDVASAMAIYRTFMDVGGVVGPSAVAALIGSSGYQAGFMSAGAVMLVPLALLTRLKRSGPISSLS